MFKKLFKWNSIALKKKTTIDIGYSKYLAEDRIMLDKEMLFDVRSKVINLKNIYFFSTCIKKLFLVVEIFDNICSYKHEP